MSKRFFSRGAVLVLAQRRFQRRDPIQKIAGAQIRFLGLAVHNAHRTLPAAEPHPPTLRCQIPACLRRRLSCGSSYPSEYQRIAETQCSLPAQPPEGRIGKMFICGLVVVWVGM